MANYNVDIIYNGSGSLPGTETLRIDGSANVLVNRTSTLNSSKFAVTGNTWHQNGLAVFSNPGNGESYPNITATAMMLGPYTTRSGTAGKYLAGIGFDHLLNYSTEGNMTYNQSPHGWIGLRTETFPGYETSSLVFATRSDTSGAANSTIERMCITPTGYVGIGTTGPSGRLHVTAPAITAAAPSLGWPVYNAEADTNSRPIYFDTAGNGSVGTAGQGATVALVLGQYYDSRVVITPSSNGGGSPGDQGQGRGKDLMLKAGTSDNGVGYKGGRLYLSGGMGYTASGYNGNVGDVLIQPFSGNVGIGTTLPELSSGYPSKLYVKGAPVNGYWGLANFETTLNSGDTNHGIIGLYNSKSYAVGDDARIMFTFKNSDQSVHPKGAFGMVNTGDYTADFQWNTRTGGGAFSEKMRFTSSGNLGIGTTAPQSIFHISTTSSSLLRLTRSSNVVGIELAGGASGGWGLYDYARSAYDIWMINGNVGIGTTAPFGTTANRTCVSVNGTTDVSLNVGTGGSQRAYLYASASLGQVGTIGAIPLILATNDNEKVRITSDGNVGIGTTAPGSKLTVSGSNSGSVPLVDLIASGTGTFQRGVRLLNSGMNSGDQIMYAVGQADNSKNMGQFYFYYSGSNSNSNRISMGLHSVDDVFNILGSGNVGIGTTSPSEKLHVIGSILASANVTAYSDIRIKTNIRTIENAIDKVKKIRGVTYDRTDDPDLPRQTGVIAQEVKEVLPEVVSGSEESKYTVAYGNMVGLLIEAIKEQQSEIDELKVLVRQLLAK